MEDRGSPDVKSKGEKSTKNQDGLRRQALQDKVQFILLLLLVAISITAAVPQAIYSTGRHAAVTQPLRYTLGQQV